MTGTVLERSLANVAGRIQKLRILRRQTLVWLILLIPAIALTLSLPARRGPLRAEFVVVASMTILGTVLARILVRQPSKTETARLVEQANPELNDSVITAVQVSEQSGQTPSVLRSMAIEEADAFARQKDWTSAVPGRQIAVWTLLSFASFVVMVSSVTAASLYGRDFTNATRSPAVTAAEKESAISVTELEIAPGDTEIERGAALTVVAKFPEALPTHVVLEVTDSEKNVRQMSMTETVDAGVFAARMEDISSDSTYQVVFQNMDGKSANDGPQKSKLFQVRTFVRPKLTQVDAVIAPPAWSNRPAEIIEDVVRLSVTEGSSVTLKLLLNKSVARAELRPREGAAIVLTPSTISAADSEAAAIVETTILAMESEAWSVYLEDAQGRTAVDEDQISIRVSPNEEPKLKVTFPGKDTNVSPLQEFEIEASASDDFELVDFGVQFTLSGSEPQEISLKPEASASSSAESNEPLQNTIISHVIAMESLKAAPDDMMSYAFWATDIGPDGQPRQVYSDIMFAEVRRFEEIFREAQQQGQQQQQQQQQNQQQGQQGSAVDGVLSLQKEILSATWNTLRAEKQRRKEGQFLQDVAVIAESQGKAIEQLQEASAQAESDPRLTALSRRAAEEMAAAQKKLEDIAADTSTARLSQALPLEQAILQTLLKMRAAETNVRQQQQQQGGGGGGGSSASQQQLQQLELDNSRNRYESEQQAQPEQEVNEQQREQLQVLNRLKELARRQQMLNDRLKQLESELRAAISEKEREEIERELKRLREEQRDMLRDVDELSERMDQAASPESTQSAEMKQQLQQARENVQQASRAMDEGKLSEAISEGTRAERQFEELKEDFRNQASSQFEESVKGLRQQARELSETQEQLAKKLAGDTTGDDSKGRPSLKSDRNREQLKQELAEQKDRLSDVIEKTKQMIEQAEQTEPLLSNTLYETLRELKDSRPEEALDATEMLAGRGMWQQSLQTEQIARKGIDQLTEGIEKAAESVLGSEAESLRRAQRQLDDATRKLASEVAAATSQTQGGQNASSDESAANPEAEAPRGSQQGEDGNRESDGNREGDGGEQAKSDDESAQKGGTSPGKGKGDEKSESASRTGRGRGSQGEKGKESSKGAGQKSKSGDDKAGGGQNTEESDGQESRSQTQQEEESGKKGSGQKGRGKAQGGQGGGGEGDASPESSESSEMSERSTSTAPEEASNDRRGQKSQGRPASSLRNGGREASGQQAEGSAGGRMSGARPLTGDEYSEWSDQLRDIEEMLEDPELRNRVAQVRDRARAMRANYKRHGEIPQWDLVKSQLLSEMQMLQQRIDQEVLKQSSDRAMVPIDREPVPEEFDTLVQRYYELLGQERVDDRDPELK